jgi:hypothetical protein
MAGSVDKPDFPGLWPPGLHQLDIGVLRVRCVEEFPSSRSRDTLMTSLEEAIVRLRISGLCLDLWCDGSFVTEKIDPEDIDIVARVPAQVYTSGTADMRHAIVWFADDDRLNNGLDTYVIPYHPPGSPMHPLTMDREDYWKRHFGTGRDPVIEKGIVALSVNGGAR